MHRGQLEIFRAMQSALHQPLQCVITHKTLLCSLKPHRGFAQEKTQSVLCSFIGKRIGCGLNRKEPFAQMYFHLSTHTYATKGAE